MRSIQTVVSGLAIAARLGIDRTTLWRKMRRLAMKLQEEFGLHPLAVPGVQVRKLDPQDCRLDGIQPLEPMIEIDLDLPDGRRMMKYGYFKPE